MSKSKSMCAGCRQDYYNRNRPGGCWNYKTAKVVKRLRVGCWENPPYSKDRAARCLSCYHPDNNDVMLALDDPRIVARAKT